MPSAIASATVVLPVPPLKLMAAMTDFGKSILDILSVPVPAPSHHTAGPAGALACTRQLRWRRAGRTVRLRQNSGQPGQRGATTNTDRSALFRFPLRQPPDAKAVSLRVSSYDFVSAPSR